MMFIPGFVKTVQMFRIYKRKGQGKKAHEPHGVLTLCFRDFSFPESQATGYLNFQNACVPLVPSLEPADRISRNINFIHLKVTPKAVSFICHQSLITTRWAFRFVRPYPQ